MNKLNYDPDSDGECVGLSLAELEAQILDLYVPGELKIHRQRSKRIEDLALKVSENLPFNISLEDQSFFEKVKIYSRPYQYENFFSGNRAINQEEVEIT
ncbi:hypothetical protein [Coxiella burnetii]|nr:hypothetical protein [Coxiella burnetii]ATN76876.1 hypothetical protein AYM94_08355 [Coxiella burnetii]ATN78793.1 hypothetical protein AYM93_08350 [Coxiella burnetii]MCF2094220.1 hypothetical protein [Coxiella burnetii]MDE3399682.1 hypothetical protein [Coxiella burnetii]PNT78846.1 hypothetical protein C2L92_08905 [Coxiella burnetii]